MSDRGQDGPKQFSQGKVVYGVDDLIWALKEGKGLHEKKMIKAFQVAKMICSGTQRYKCAPKLTGLGQIQ